MTVVSIRMSVVFPAPLGPITPKISPSGMFRLTLSTAVSSPNRFVSRSVSTMSFNRSPAEKSRASSSPNTYRYENLGDVRSQFNIFAGVK